MLLIWVCLLVSADAENGSSHFSVSGIYISYPHPPKGDGYHPPQDFSLSSEKPKKKVT